MFSCVLVVFTKESNNPDKSVITKFIDLREFVRKISKRQYRKLVDDIPKYFNDLKI